MIQNSIRFGPFSLLLPADAQVLADVDATLSPRWSIALGRFCLFVHLDRQHGLGDLRTFVEQQTRKEAAPSPIVVNGVPGVTHGGYDPPRTWIDWWFKKGDTMLCMCLQSTEFPCTDPNVDELSQHSAIIASLQYEPTEPAVA